MNVRIFGIMKINDKLLDTGQIKRKIKKKSAVTTTYQLSTVKSIDTIDTNNFRSI